MLHKEKLKSGTKLPKSTVPRLDGVSLEILGSGLLRRCLCAWSGAHRTQPEDPGHCTGRTRPLAQGAQGVLSGGAGCRRRSAGHCVCQTVQRARQLQRLPTARGGRVLPSAGIGLPLTGRNNTLSRFSAPLLHYTSLSLQHAADSFPAFCIVGAGPLACAGTDLGCGYRPCL